jgi:hypothetical protein
VEGKLKLDASRAESRVASCAKPLVTFANASSRLLRPPEHDIALAAGPSWRAKFKLEHQSESSRQGILEEILPRQDSFDTSIADGGNTCCPHRSLSKPVGICANTSTILLFSRDSE